MTFHVREGRPWMAYIAIELRMSS